MQASSDRPAGRGQSPEDTLKRISGIPKTLQELEAEQVALEEERNYAARRAAGMPTGRTTQPAGNGNQREVRVPHAERDREQEQRPHREHA